MEIVIFETDPAEFGLAFSALDVGTTSIFIDNGLTGRTGLASGYFIEICEAIVNISDQEAFFLVATEVLFESPLVTAFLTLKWFIAIFLLLATLSLQQGQYYPGGNTLSSSNAQFIAVQDLPVPPPPGILQSRSKTNDQDWSFVQNRANARQTNSQWNVPSGGYSLYPIGYKTVYNVTFFTDCPQKIVSFLLKKFPD